MMAVKGFKAKAAEVRGLLGFADHLLCKYADKLTQGPNPEKNRMFTMLTHAGKAALGFEQLLISHSRALPDTAAQQLFSAYMRFTAMAYRSGMPTTPKSHLMIHCLQQAKGKGNPRMFSCYRDESLNGIIREIARSVHQKLFADSVLTKVHIGEQSAVKKAARDALRLQSIGAS